MSTVEFPGPAPQPPHRDAVVRQLAYLNIFGLVSFVICRAPTILKPFTVPVVGLELEFNAGWVIVFAPMVMLGWMGWITYLDRATPAARNWRGADGVLARLALVGPVVLCLAVAAQFFILFAPQGNEACHTFSRWRLLFDPSLRGFQPQYCMGMPEATQRAMPHLLDPVFMQGWFQLLCPVFVALLAWRMGRRWRRAAA